MVPAIQKSVGLGTLRKKRRKGSKKRKRKDLDMPFSKLHTAVIIKTQQQLYLPTLTSH